MTTPSAAARTCAFSRTAAVLAGLVLTVLGAAAAGAAPTARTAHVEAGLVPETTAAQPGKTLYVALHQTIAPGWHTYWRNPGAAGPPPVGG